MGKGRLEAFTDGVLAVVITIMVLELKVPHGATPEALLPLLPVFFTYALSFVYIAIYWVNHHHYFQLVRHVTGGMLWANLFLLFWLSLVPFTTGWMGENHFAPWPVFLYGTNLLAAAVGYTIMTQVTLRSHGPESDIAKAIGRDKKGRISLLIYALSVLLAFWWPIVSCALFVVVALMWFVPDKRIERVLGSA